MRRVTCEAEAILHASGGSVVPFFTNELSRRIQNFHGSPANQMAASRPYKEIRIDDSMA